MSDVKLSGENGRFSLFDFYSKNGPSLNGIDVFMLGNFGGVDRLGEYISILKMFVTEDEKPLFTEITIILTPHENQDDFQVNIRKAVAKFVKDQQLKVLDEKQLTALLHNVRIVKTEKCQPSEIIDIIASTGPQAAIIVWNGSIYRSEDVHLEPREVMLPEDVWFPHFHALLTRLEAALSSKIFVIMDAGVVAPSRNEHQQLYSTLERCSFFGVEFRENSDLDWWKQVSDWYDRVQKGDLGVVLKEIDSLHGKSLQQKKLMTLQMYARAKFWEHPKSVLENDPTLLEGLAPAEMLEIAVLAEQVGANIVAKSLLVGAVEQLYSQEQLEKAFSLAHRLQMDKVSVFCEQALEKWFPGAGVLRDKLLEKLVKKQKWDEASALLRRNGALEDINLAEFYNIIQENTQEGQLVDCSALLASVQDRLPQYMSKARMTCTELLENEGKRRDAISTLLEGTNSRHEFELAEALRLLSLIERGRLTLDEKIDDELIISVVERVVNILARHPHAGYLRLRLCHILSPEVLGSIGLPVLVYVLLSLASREVSIRHRPPLNQRPSPCSADEFETLLVKGLEWMEQEGPMVMGTKPYPVDRLGVSVESALAYCARLIGHSGSETHDHGDRKFSMQLITLASSIGLQCSEPGEELAMIRLGANRFARGGSVQQARNLAEHCLVLAKEDGNHRRLAWYAFADVYGHLGSTNEAFISLACAHASNDEVTWDQVWYESMLAIRLLRSVRLLETVRPFIDRAKRALPLLGYEDEGLHRVEMVELQLRLFTYGKKGEQSPNELSALIEDVVNNAEKVLDAKDELDPVAMLLASVMGRARLSGVSIPSSAVSILDQMKQFVGPKTLVLIEASCSDKPSNQQLAALAEKMEAASYVQDIGHDINSFVILARCLLQTVDNQTSSAVAYAIEGLADQAIKSPSQNGNGQLWGLLSSPDGPAELAKELAHDGLQIVMLGLNHQGLVRIIVHEGLLEAPVAEQKRSIF